MFLDLPGAPLLFPGPSWIFLDLPVPGPFLDPPGAPLDPSWSFLDLSALSWTDMDLPGPPWTILDPSRELAFITYLVF